MQYVLCVTNACNYRCDYCDVPKGEQRMTLDTARRVADMALRDALASRSVSTCLSFFGGEPLLMKPLIAELVEYCDAIGAGTGVAFHYRMTTNGALLDPSYVEYATRRGFKIALSIDGTPLAHDSHRSDIEGVPTYERAHRAALLLLRHQPFAAAMATVNPDTGRELFASVRHLHALGFQTIVTTPNYRADWTDDDLDALADQYALMADWYAEKMLTGQKLRLPIFDTKLVGERLPAFERAKCVPAKQRVQIRMDGTIFPCSEFVFHEDLAIGTVTDGIDAAKLALMRREAARVMDECAGCALSRRCDHLCGCKNLASSGHINRVSPFLCAHERALIPIADRLSERVFQQPSGY